MAGLTEVNKEKKQSSEDEATVSLYQVSQLNLTTQRAPLAEHVEVPIVAILLSPVMFRSQLRKNDTSPSLHSHHPNDVTARGSKVLNPQTSVSVTRTAQAVHLSLAVTRDS
jgi:hypothetical protein